MSLVLDGIGFDDGPDKHISGVSMTLARGGLHVLLGPTLAGKTTLMRLMAGLDKPSAGRLLMDGRDVTGLPVRKRSVAMVYQQFVNYPTLTVYENIASPLRVAGLPREEIKQRVAHAAKLLRLEKMLDRLPAQLSGGQQQRTAIARALVKRAELVLLDEPLGNLDYKLREELREELPPLFAESGAILVYATTEPTEALLLGGETAALSQGRLVQFGPTATLYRQPATIEAARVFSDPPLNELAIERRGNSLTTKLGQFPVPPTLSAVPDGRYTMAFRADAVSVGVRLHHAIDFDGSVSVSEINGSESFVHVVVGDATWVSLVPGVYAGQPGDAVSVHLDLDQVFLFDANGAVATQTLTGRGGLMATITLDGIGHAYGPAKTAADYALKPLHHVWQQGRAYALLGPSGCGKTTLLNIISGLVTPSHGRLLFDGVDVTRLPTEQRNIAQVFQFPVIYDTMTVAENLGFPLRNRGVDRATIARRVAEIATMLDLTPELGRRARGLTADAKQKISLGRGLVRADVAAVLFDEPLTVIDPALKWELRSKLKAVHRALDLLMIYVTHDQTEALTFADLVVVMNEGRVLQIGTPAELFETPAHTFVGYFIGSPGMNLLPAAIGGHQAVIDGHTVDLSASYDTMAAVEIGIRPEFTMLAPAGGLPVRIDRIEDLGRRRLARVSLGAHRLVATVPQGYAPAGDHASVVFAREQTHVFRNSERVAGARE